MTTNLNFNSKRRGATAAGMGGLALASVLLLCGAGNAPIANFSPQGVMQADLNAGGRSVTNAASVIATNVAASSLSATSAAVGSLTAANMTVTGALTATNFTLPFSGVTSTPTTLAGYGIADAYTKTASDGRYAPLAGSTNITTLGAVTTGSIPFANLTSTPATLAGYGIADAYNKTASDGRYAPIAVPYGSITGTPTTLSGYGIAAVPWSALAGKPTTLSGYGITDPTVLATGTYADPAFISSLSYAKLVGAPTSWAWSSITNTPTTLAGYGIADAYTKTASDGRYAPSAGSTNITTLGAVTTGSIPFANVTGNPVTIASGKTLGVSNTLTFAGTDGSTLNVGAGGTLGSAAFATTNAFLAPGAIGTTVQAYSANTTTLGNTVNSPNSLVQTDGNGLIIDSVLRAGAKSIYVSRSLGSDTRTGLSKYSLIMPFATLTAAAAAAAVGDTIVAEDGVFTDKNLVLVTGVNWLFLPAATITVTGAANGDMIFKDAGIATTATIAGCGQTFSITSTTSTTNTALTGLSIAAVSNVTVYGIGISVSAPGSGCTATALACSGSSTSATVAITGNLVAVGGVSGAGYGIYFGGSNGGTVVINGNVTGGAPIYGYGFYATGTTAGIVTVTQRLAGSYSAVSDSTAATVTCGQLTDSNVASIANNRLTINSPVPYVQLMSGTTTGFNDAYYYGPQDQIMELTASGTLASGTVTLPADNTTRVGERLTIMSTQTITALTVSVASGTIYGWSGGTLSPGSITFQKIAANIWAKL